MISSHRHTKPLKWIAALLMTALMAGCGGSNNSAAVAQVDADTLPPSISTVIAANGAVDVAANAKIGIVFSEAMAPATVSATTITVMQGTTQVAGAVTYTGMTAIFKPTSALAFNTLYTVSVSSAVTDLAGNKLSGNQAAFPASGNHAWSFTTGATLDTLVPRITSTINANGSTGVATNTQIGAFFSEQIDPQSVNAQSFVVTQGATPVPGTITYSGLAANFTPTSPLAANTTYSATFNSAVIDMAGNALSGNQVVFPAPGSYTWSFTTGASADNSPPLCSLGQSDRWDYQCGAKQDTHCYIQQSDGRKQNQQHDLHIETGHNANLRHDQLCW